MKSKFFKWVLSHPGLVATSGVALFFVVVLSFSAVFRSAASDVEERGFISQCCRDKHSITECKVMWKQYEYYDLRR